MAKMTISESRLHELIQESIYEVLQEAQYDEGLGHWLGNAFQTMKNKWNNFKGDFNAGRNKARWDNRDYDSFSYYGDEADNFRNYGGYEYGADRYNKTVERNARAKQYGRGKYGDEGMPYPNQGGGRTNTPPQSPQNQANPSPTQVQGHPDLGGGQQTPQTPQSTSAAPQQTQQQAPAAQPQRATQPMNGRQNPVNPNDTALNNKAAWEAKMKKMGLVNKGSVQRPQWHNANGGKLTPDQKNAIQQWSRFKLNEQKKELDRLIKEIKSRKK